jgi:hypothetical protein
MPPSTSSKNQPADKAESKAESKSADKSESESKSKSESKSESKPKHRKSADGQKIARKRGPPRPHRKLAQDVLDKRIHKLQRRIERVQTQLDDAQRHIVGYRNEEQYRKDHPEEAPPPVAEVA